MKSLKALVLVLGQWGLHKIKLDKYLKSCPMILAWQGLHEKLEGSSTDFRSMGTS